MIVLKKVDEIVHFIQQKYPTMEFDGIGVSHEAISDICNVILKKGKCNKAKKNLVMTLNNANSALRKSLRAKTENNTNLRKQLEDNDYSRNDFCTYTTEIANLVCKLSKVKCDRRNQIRVFKRCQLSFKENEACTSSDVSSQTNMLDKDNHINVSSAVCVKRKLFIDSSLQN
ncbi:unnamed protein product [Macrosiphum euphorbiae]|uniref:Uncharacterized protein n=1 Tax=Macrosiphum euphorbiae TaxID=13131 RepID=A0AAV0X8N4_9HEMI|nr:unnamed protein product [Macrosiphum euphorbiae]